MRKKEWKGKVREFGLEFYEWLDVLPITDEHGNPITLEQPPPIVHYPSAKKEEITETMQLAGFHFESPRLHYIAGYHIPKGHEMRTLVQN